MSDDGQLTVLCVGLNATDRLVEDLSMTADDVTTSTAATVQSALAALSSAADTQPTAADCLLLDADCPEDGVERAVERLRTERPAVPVIVAGATGAAVRDALDAGAADVVDREGPARAAVVATRVRNAVAQARSARDGNGRAQDGGDDGQPPEPADPALEALLERSCDRLSVLDEDGTYTFVSPAVEHLMGYDPAELLGTSGFEYVHPEDKSRVQAVFERIVANEDEVHSVEYRLRDAEGEWRWVESRGTNRMADPAIEGIVVNSREITDRKEREQQLEAERKRFRTLFERLPEPTVEFEFRDGDPVIKQVNPAFERTFGYEAAELRGDPIDEHVVPPERSEEAETLNERVAAGERFISEEIVRQTTEGDRHFLFQTAVYEAGNEGFAVYADITAQKERQQELREEKALSDAILDTVPDVFYLFDEHGQFLRWNDRATEVSGFTDEEIAEMHPAEFVVEEDRQAVFEAMAEVIEHDRPVQFEARARRKHGDPIPYEYTGAKLTDDAGNMLGIVGLGRDVSERNARERELERNNDLLRQTQAMADIGTWEYDVTADDLWVSDQLKRIYGLSPEQELGFEAAMDALVDEDEQALRAALDRVIEEGASYELELRLVDEDGNERWVIGQGEPQFDDGEVAKIRGTLQDVTEQKARERKLREEQALTDTIFDALPDVFYAFDEQVEFIRWNDQLSAVTGYSDEEIAEMHPSEFVAPEDREQIFTGIANVIEHGETVTIEAQFETKDGEQIPYEFTGARMTDETGEILGLVGIGRDISERKERQRRFEAVFNNTYQFTGLLEPDGTLLEANETALQFGGVDRDEVIGERLWEAYWFQNDDQAREAAREAVESAREGQLYRDELEVQGREGTEMIDFSVRPIVDENGEVTLLIPEGRLITDLKDRERQLKLVNRFLRHNLRNKMSVIQGMGKVLQGEFGTTEYASHLDNLTEAATDLIELSETAHEFLQITVEADPEPRAIEPTEILSRVVPRLRTEFSGADISVAVESEAAVTADYRLEAVLQQLIENGIVHNDRKQPSVTVTVTDDDGRISIRVADNGPEIPTDELSGIVTDEEQTQLTHGTGFGLWLVRAVVDDYAGDLVHETAPHGGNVMIVRLPVHTDQPVDPERQRSSGVS